LISLVHLMSLYPEDVRRLHRKPTAIGRLTDALLFRLLRDDPGARSAIMAAVAANKRMAIAARI
jgi:hypothetical protein